MRADLMKKLSLSCSLSISPSLGMCLSGLMYCVSIPISLRLVLAPLSIHSLFLSHALSLSLPLSLPRIAVHQTLYGAKQKPIARKKDFKNLISCFYNERTNERVRERERRGSKSNAILIKNICSKSTEE